MASSLELYEFPDIFLSERPSPLTTPSPLHPLSLCSQTHLPHHSASVFLFDSLQVLTPSLRLSLSRSRSLARPCLRQYVCERASSFLLCALMDDKATGGESGKKDNSGILQKCLIEITFPSRYLRHTSVVRLEGEAVRRESVGCFHGQIDEGHQKCTLLSVCPKVPLSYNYYVARQRKLKLPDKQHTHTQARVRTHIHSTYTRKKLSNKQTHTHSSERTCMHTHKQII